MTAPDFSARILRVLREQNIRRVGTANPSSDALNEVVHQTAPEQFVAPLNEYLRLLAHWNSRLDLSAARNHAELVDLFVADACALAALTPAATGAWVDVGSGAGAPGIGLKILRPELDLTLVEPLSKRISFLRTVLGTLGLTNIRAKKARSEDLGDGEFETAVSRATLKPPDWLKEGARISSGRVWVLLAQDEPPSLDGWSIATEARYNWPLTAVERRAVCYSRD